MHLLQRLRSRAANIGWYWYTAAAIAVFVSLLFSGALESVARPYWEAISLSLSPRALVASIVVEIGLYFAVAGALQLIVVACAVVVLTPLIFTRTLRGYAQVIARFVEFNVALLISGGLANVIWVAVARDRMYVAGDPVVEFFAFLPYSRAIYNYDWGAFRGHLVGGSSDAQLFLLWASLAVLAWVAAWVLVRFAQRHRRVTAA